MRGTAGATHYNTHPNPRTGVKLNTAVWRTEYRTTHSFGGSAPKLSRFLDKELEHAWHAVNGNPPKRFTERECSYFDAGYREYVREREEYWAKIRAEKEAVEEAEAEAEAAAEAAK